MATKFSSITNLVLLYVAALVLVQASARNMQQTQDLPLHGASAPTKAESPTINVPLDDQKNFIYGAGIGGAAGVGGFLGMPGGGGDSAGMTLPFPTPLLGGSGPFGGFPGGLGGSVPRSSNWMVTP